MPAEQLGNWEVAVQWSWRGLTSGQLKLVLKGGEQFTGPREWKGNGMNQGPEARPAGHWVWPHGREGAATAPEGAHPPGLVLASRQCW